MNRTLKKWLPAIITICIILIVILISCKKNTLMLNVTKVSNIDYSKIEEIVKMLESDDTKGNAANELNELYKDQEKDDVFYLTSAKIIMATDNDINAVSSLNYVKNKTDEYYRLLIRATAGQFFTMGEVPNDLLNTSIEAANKYTDEIDFQLLAGELYYDKDNYIGALYYLDKALQIDGNNVDANYYYALNLYVLGEQEEAISYMEKAKKLYKGDDEEYKKAMDNYIDIMKEGKR